MRKRALILSILSSAGVLIVGWQVGTAGETATAPSNPATAQAAPPSAAATSPGTASSTETGSASATSSAAAPTPSSKSGTFTGDSIATRYGDVQVQVTVAGGKITDVTALQLTDQDNRSIQISNQAAPVLREEVLAAQSASVDIVSGATYTSAGYLQSLQAALDQAGG